MTVDLADYRTSHTAADKPAVYRQQFDTKSNVKALYWRLEQNILDRLLPIARCSNQSLLDFACGTGRVLSHLHQRFDRCAGVDISQAMVNDARNSGLNVDLLVGDVTRGEVSLNFQPDVITAFRFFLNAEPELRSETLTWIHQQLVDDGKLICNFHLNPTSLVGSVMNGMKRIRGWQTTPMLSVASATALLQSHGFRVSSVFGYGYFWYGRKNLWAPLAMLYPVESLLTNLRFPPSFARNFMILADKK